MDIHRAARNLKLLEDAQGESEQMSSPHKSLEGTQVTEFDMSSDDHVFINTQIQGRIDDEERLEAVKRQMSKFKYQDSKIQDDTSSRSETTNSISKKTSPVKRNIKKTKSPAKKVTKTKGTAKKGTKMVNSKSYNLLQQLSGKKSKIRQIIQDDPKLEFDTYNEKEWDQIKLKLQGLVQNDDGVCDYNEVFEYIYGDLEPSQSMWDASQQKLVKKELPASTGNNAIVIDDMQDNNDDREGVQVITLSQLMENSKESIKEKVAMNENEIDLTQRSIDSKANSILVVSGDGNKITKEMSDIKEISNTGETEDFDEIKEIQAIVIDEKPEPSDNVSIIYDSMDEFETLIPLVDDQLKTKPINKTTGKFSVEYRAQQVFNRETISTNEIQVPATRSTTMTKSCTQSNRALDVNIIMSKSQDIATITNQFTIIDDTAMIMDSDEEFDTNKYQLLHLRLDFLPIDQDFNTRKPTTNLTYSRETTFITKMDEDITNSPAKVIRQNLKSLGLKTSNTKNEMLESLQIASQKITNAESINDIYDYLTQTVKSMPDLLEMIYTFQPIRLSVLIKRLIEQDSFIGHIDSMTIRDWTDQQGISIQQ